MSKELHNLQIQIVMNNITELTKKEKDELKEIVSHFIDEEQFLTIRKRIVNNISMDSNYIGRSIWDDEEVWDEKVLKEMEEKWKLSKGDIDDIREDTPLKKLPKHCIITGEGIETFKTVADIREDLRSHDYIGPNTDYGRVLFIINGRQVNLETVIKEVPV